MTNRVADAYDGRKPQSASTKKQHENVLSNVGIIIFIDIRRVSEQPGDDGEKRRRLWCTPWSCCASGAGSASEERNTSRGASRFSDGITKVWTSDLMGNGLRACAGKTMLARPRAAHAERGIFQTARSDRRLPLVSMNDKGRWGSLKEKQKKAHAELKGKQDCVAYLMPDVNDVFGAELEAGLTIDAKQMKREQEKMQPIRDALRTDGREGFEDQRYTQSIRNALIKEKTWDPFGRDLKTGEDLFQGEFDNDNVPGNH